MQKKSLLLAIGNASRGDDGLGWAFAETLEKKGSFQGDIALRYQLQVEDAELCAHYDQVFFVDAWKTDKPTSFLYTPCLPVQDFSFTTHAVSPQGILFLCRELYGVMPEAWLLQLRGISWDLGQGLSAQGQKTLRESLLFFESQILFLT